MVTAYLRSLLQFWGNCAHNQMLLSAVFEPTTPISFLIVNFVHRTDQKVLLSSKRVIFL